MGIIKDEEKHIEGKTETIQLNGENSQNEADKAMKNNYELSEKQKKDLEAIRKKLDKDVEKLDKHAQILKSLHKYLHIAKEYCYNYPSRVLSSLMLFFLVIIPLLIYCHTEKIDTLSKKETISNSETILHINMNDSNKLQFKLEKLCIENNIYNNKTGQSSKAYTTLSNFNWLRNDLNTDLTNYNIDGADYTIDKETELEEFIITEQYGYIKYTNKEFNGAKEIIFSESKPVNMNTSMIQKKDSRKYEYVTPINIQSYVNSYNDSFLMLKETIGGGKLNIETLLNQIEYMEKSAVISDNTNGIKIELEGLGDYYIKNETEDKNIGLVYKSGVLVMRDMLNEQDLMYITSIDNKVVGCYKQDLLETTTDGIYVTANYNKEDTSGYNTIAIIAGNNLYVVKFVDEQIKEDFTKQLGLELKGLKINTIQEIIVGEN